MIQKSLGEGSFGKVALAKMKNKQGIEKRFALKFCKQKKHLSMMREEA